MVYVQNKLTRLALALLVAAILLPDQALLGQSQQISWNLSKGDQFETSLGQRSATKTKVDARETSIVSETEIVMSWNVTDVSDAGDATIEQAVVSIKLSVGDPAVPAQAVKYDTADSNEDITKTSKKLLEQVRPLVGLKFEVVMSKLGLIKSVDLPEETLEAITKLPDALNLRNLFTEDGLKDILGAAAVVLPKDEFQKDDSWTDERKINLAFGTFNRKRTYTYLGNRKIDNREFAEFGIVSTMEKLEDQTTTPPKGKLSSFEGSGKLMLDIEKGFFSSSSVKNEAKTEEAYREKKMNTVVTNEIDMSITKK